MRGIEIRMATTKNCLQIENDRLVDLCGFDMNLPGLIAGLSAECGEVADVVAKMEGWKKIKSSDDITNLKGKLESELADVLVFLLQIASKYSIDIQDAYMRKVDVVKSRTFIN